MAVAIQSGRRVFFIDLALREFNGLVEAIGAGRNQSRLGDLLDYVGFGSLETGAAGFPAFHIVIGQNFDVGPPRLAVEMGLRGLLGV